MTPFHPTPKQRRQVEREAQKRADEYIAEVSAALTDAMRPARQDLAQVTAAANAARDSARCIARQSYDLAIARADEVHAETVAPAKALLADLEREAGKKLTRARRRAQEIRKTYMDGFLAGEVALAAGIDLAKAATDHITGLKVQMRLEHLAGRHTEHGCTGPEDAR